MFKKEGDTLAFLFLYQETIFGKKREK